MGIKEGGDFRKPDRTAMGHVRPGMQLPFDGMDELSRKIAEASATHARRDQAEHDKALRAAPIIPIQRYVAGRFQTEVLDKRESLWKETLETLEHLPPTRVNLVSISDTDFEAELGWHLSRLHTIEDQEAEVTIYIHPQRLPIGKKPTKGEPNPLFTATALLSGTNNPNIPNKLVVPEILLDTKLAEDRDPMLVRADLARKLSEQSLPQTNLLRVGVHAKLLGRGEEVKIYDLELKPADFGPIGSRKNEDRFLSPESVDDIYTDFASRPYRGEKAIPDPTHADIEAFLKEKYINPGDYEVTTKYDSLAATLIHVKEATPVDPTAKEFNPARFVVTPSVLKRVWNKFV